MSRFNRFLLAIVLGLGITVAGLSVAMARLGPVVDTMSTATMLDGTLVDTQIELEFTEPMQIQTVEKNFHIAPKVPGSFSWSGDEMLFIPHHTLAYQTRYTLTIDRGARGQDGKALLRDYRGSFTTQAQHLAYLGTRGRDKGRVVLSSTTGKREILGPDDGLVTDYGVSLDKSLAVLVKRGSPGERPDEIWLVSLQDGSSQLLLHQPDLAMSQPRISPDDQYVAFLATNVLLCRKYYGCYRDRTTPIIKVLDLHSRKLSSFKSNVVPITDFLDFSPAGQLAFTDLGSALTLAMPNGSMPTNIPNQGNSLQFSGFDPSGGLAVFVGQTASSIGGDILVYTKSKYVDISKGIYDSSTPSFSPTGTEIAYAGYRGEKGIEPIYGINVYDLKSKRTTRLSGESRRSDWAPAWSVSGTYVAFVRSAPQEAMYLGSGTIWISRVHGHASWSLHDSGENINWVS